MSETKGDQTEVNCEVEEINQVRGRRSCVSTNLIIDNRQINQEGSNNNDENRNLNEDEDEMHSNQKQFENTQSTIDNAIIEQYEDIIANLRSQLNSIYDYLLSENEQNFIQQEQVINYVKEAHICPFNCFKGEEIKNLDTTTTPLIRDPSKTAVSKNLDISNIRDKNLSTPGSINFVQDKHFKANLFLQKKLENAEKQIEKTKLSCQSKFVNLQNKHDELLQILNEKSEKNEQLSEKVEGLSNKQQELEEQDKLMELKYIKIKDFIKEQFKLEFNEGEDEENFSEFLIEWENLIQNNKTEVFTLSSDLELLKKDFSIGQKNAQQRQNEHDALIQKIAQAEIQLEEFKQENNHLSDNLTYETQNRKCVELNYKKDLSEIYELLEDESKDGNMNIQDLKDNIAFKIRYLQRDCEKMNSHKENNQKLDEENFQMKLEVQRAGSLSNNLEKIRNEYDQLNYKYLQLQEQNMILEQENQRIIREKQTSDEIQVENLKNLNQKLAQELVSLNKTRSRESSDLQEKIEKISNKLSSLKKENEDLKSLIRSRNNTQDNCQDAIEEIKQNELVNLKQLDIIEEQKRGESLDSDRKSSIIFSLEDARIDICEDINGIPSSQPSTLTNQENNQILDLNQIVDEDHKPVFEISNLLQLKKAFISLYKKLKDDKIYAEQTAIDTKMQLAEMAMSKDYFEHNFVKLLKKVK